MSFQNPVDICNRSAQHCGVARISDFTEDSVQAGEFAFAYDKVRRAELRRNVWMFATRKAAIRPMGVGTMIISPTLYSSTTTYTFGSIVSDQSGALWQSRTQSNLGNTPGNSSAWELYCGPTTASPYDTTGTTGYYTGELVYQTPGDGTALIYLSLQDGNSQDPRVPSEWSATVQYSKDNVVTFYAAWAIGTTYAAGAMVTYNTGLYISLAAANTGNEPDTATTWWALTSATLAPPFYNSLTAYVPGMFVTYLGINYVNILARTGTIPPGNTSVWVPQATPTYYVSLMDFNLNNDPSPGYVLWAVGTTYSTGDQIGASDGFVYSSVGNGNVGNDPTLTTGFWTNTGVLNPWTTVNNFGKANDQWLQITIAITDALLSYPIGAGPLDQTSTRNAYRLPANYLRHAPQDPKAGSVSFLGAPTSLMYTDWNWENGYIVSRESQPILLRFVADVTDVTTFDDMFCEGLAARIAMETVERITQSTAKLVSIKDSYKTLMTEARLVNGIETGSVEPPMDNYLSCRI